MAIRNPFEVIKQNRQFGEFKTVKKAVITVWSKRGPRGFYAGYSALLCREIPCTIIEMGLYEALIRYISYPLFQPQPRLEGAG